MARIISIPGGEARLFIAVVSIVILSMAALGWQVNAHLRNSGIQRVAETSAMFMNFFFEPLIRDVEREGTVPAHVEDRLDDLMREGLRGRLIENAVIWWRDGTIAYATEKTLMGRVVHSPQLDAAFAGAVVPQLEMTPDHEDDTLGPLEIALLEVYVPLIHADTGEIIAVGEFYERADGLERQLRRAEAISWALVGSTTALMSLLLFYTGFRAKRAVDRQRNRLRLRLIDLRKLSRQNVALRQQAEQARLDAFKINEDLLNQFGSDIHDGPLQMLSLIILRLNDLPSSGAGSTDPQQEEDRRRTTELAVATMQELRNIAYGLVMPELEHLDTAQTLRLAVDRHENLTGVRAALTIGDLPAGLPGPVRICLYRVVQETLNNAFRHAPGSVPAVSATASEQFLEVVVSDDGPGPKGANADHLDAPGLGMIGLRRRLQTFNGTLEVGPEQGGGTRVKAVLPIG